MLTPGLREDENIVHLCCSKATTVASSFRCWKTAGVFFSMNGILTNSYLPNAVFSILQIHLVESLSQVKCFDKQLHVPNFIQGRHVIAILVCKIVQLSEIHTESHSTTFNTGTIGEAQGLQDSTTIPASTNFSISCLTPSFNLSGSLWSLANCLGVPYSYRPLVQAGTLRLFRHHITKFC